tara:strand:- start:1573 stop:1728 length:156 start_codon:yes stop_codon:yes gene_type:complete
MIKITNTVTGKIVKYEGKLMVAPNGMVFVKAEGRTIWASACTDFVAVEVQK